MAVAKCNLCKNEVDFNLPRPYAEIKEDAIEHLKDCSGAGDLSMILNPFSFFEMPEETEHHKESFEFTRKPLYFDKGDRYETGNDKCACCPRAHVFSAKHSIDVMDELTEFMLKRADTDKYKVRKFKITIEEICSKNEKYTLDQIKKAVEEKDPHNMIVSKKSQTDV